ncbi:WS/DGAT/MGAT family O-acyltransferase [Aldersonia kunmingensis]|uniref:WS/DGAT/MGAT family O-acyltransferase n=1 Tax=Aldersonia kunmingensis TaxID=408066 RepID=UPI0008310845|nr:wax ester/triacylglycerol synthase family O-acyltransferase [Aldersonia kunmingensis]
MERMQGIDAGYLYMETPTMHMHTLKVALIEPREVFTMVRFKDELLSRLNQLPPLRRRALPAPFALNHPLWIFDRPIDPDRHVFHHTVPAPGGMAELEALIGTVASTPLDRSIPLWELHVCEGLADGRVAVIGKLHHALADGIAANALLANITDQNHSAQTDLVTRVEQTPSTIEQVRLALRDAVALFPRLGALLWRTSVSLRALVRHRRHSDVAVPRPVLDAPRTSFNGPLTSRRIFATCTLPLDEIKEIRRTHDVTINDVVLGVVAGALRRWMGDRGERLSTALVAGVPVGTDPPNGPVRLGGNRVSNLFTTLATDIDDPFERLREISRTTAEAKNVQQTLGPSMLIDWVQFTPPGPFSAALRLYSKSRAAAKHPPPLNVIVSNVRGPGDEVTISGARLSDLFSVGPILEGIGLNVTAWSYGERLNISLLSCPDLLDDLGPLVAELRPALDELHATEKRVAK